MSFNQDNTNGYTDNELVILNDKLNALLTENGITDESDNPDLYKHLSEKTLSDYDSTREGNWFAIITEDRRWVEKIIYTGTQSQAVDNLHHPLDWSSHYTKADALESLKEMTAEWEEAGVI